MGPLGTDDSFHSWDIRQAPPKLIRRSALPPPLASDRISIKKDGLNLGLANIINERVLDANLLGQGPDWAGSVV